MGSPERSDAVNEIDLHAELPIEQLKLDLTSKQRELYQKFYEVPEEPNDDDAR